MAGDTIDQVVVNLSGGNPASSSIGVEVSIAGHEVGESDLRRALQHGRQANGASSPDSQSRRLIHSIPIGYSIDDNRGIRDPRGMLGDRLGVRMHLVTAGASAVRNLATCIGRCHLSVAGFVVSPYAAGLASLVEDEMDLGVTLVDMGGGTTTIALFFGGNLIHTDCIPIGGIHVTTDIARGLSTTLAHAERLKTLYGHALSATNDEREMIDVPRVGEEQEETEPQRVPRSLLFGIMQPRLEETFELVRSRLETSGLARLVGRRVVLTGGASQLPGLRDLAALILDKQVRIGRPNRALGLAEATSGPAFSVCAGLLTSAVESNLTAARQPIPKTRHPSSFMGRLGDWVREHF
jgi:cell division protein FtsA